MASLPSVAARLRSNGVLSLLGSLGTAYLGGSAPKPPTAVSATLGLSFSCAVFRHRHPPSSWARSLSLSSLSRSFASKLGLSYAISSLLGGGGGLSLSNSATSRSGDSTTGPNTNGQGYSFAQDSSFSVGSGTASGNASATATPTTSGGGGSGLDPSTLIYAGLGLVALVVLLPLLRR